MYYKLVLKGPVEGLEEFRVLEWHKQPGEQVEVEDLIVELETHKVVFELNATTEVFMRRILAEEGAWAKLDEPLAIFSDSADEEIPDDVSDAVFLQTEAIEV